MLLMRRKNFSNINLSNKARPENDKCTEDVHALVENVEVKLQGTEVSVYKSSWPKARKGR